MSTHQFDANAYGPLFAQLLAEERENPLGPGKPNAIARPLLESMTLERAFAPHPIGDRNMAQACLAGLWLYHDFLEESHAISQQIRTATGSFWHGLMHRREPDSWNSKYWFERVGQHPVFPTLCNSARELADNDAPLPETRFLVEQNRWNPFAFIDLCEAARLGKTSAESLCRRIQLKEWRLLFDFCYRQAISELP